MNAGPGAADSGGPTAATDELFDERADRAVEIAPAKINLALHVVGRRPDGYHLLDSLVAFAEPPAADRLTLVRRTVDAVPAGDEAGAGPARFEIAGPFASGLSAGPDNLVLRALDALEAARHNESAPARSAAPETRYDVRLEKHLPVAAGIGGGSADAAALVRAWRRLCPTALPDARLSGIALGLGADVPACLAGRPVRMGGIGERLERLPPGALPALPIVLARPPVAVPTAEVFRRLARRDNPPMPDRPTRLADPAEVARWLAGTRNDLQDAARAVAPAIDDVLAALAATPGALLARLSGSGATCFAIYRSDAAAAAAAAALAARHREWWVTASATGPA